ncbi:hypothetical protein MTBSS4_180060 [Magnetospirillum sp. SS-4]|nr:hypothetical protein MTBSS4_180060 [Magnetospirillum sp. SS-4]
MSGGLFRPCHQYHGEMRGRLREGRGRRRPGRLGPGGRGGAGVAGPGTTVILQRQSRP